MSPRSRYAYESSEPEKVAYALAHAGYSAVRRLEILETFGFDIREAEAQANQIRTPRSTSDVDAAVLFLRNRKELRDTLSVSGSAFGSTLSPDDQGEQQIGYDAAAMSAMAHVASLAGLPLFGEEDEHRDDGGPQRRGERLRYLMQNELGFAITDALDGSNQAAGMSQRSGWGSCAMVRTPGVPDLTAAVVLGDGRGYVSALDGVWMSEASHPDGMPAFYLIKPNLSGSGFDRPHFIIPASKSKLVAHTHEMMKIDADVQWISPLGGNPGILAGMLGGRAVAAMQPAAYAWDHMAALILAGAGFTVLDERADESYTATTISTLLLEDMAAGRRTQTLYIGRTPQLARRIRAADVGARAV